MDFIGNQTVQGLKEFQCSFKGL